MARSRSTSPKTLWWLAGPAAGLAALYAWLSTLPVVPADGATVFYPSLILYHFTATALATALALLAMLVFGLWLPMALGRRSRWPAAGLAVLLALGASGLACWGALPQTFTPYRHVDRAALNGQVYQLGLRAMLADDAYYYVLCACDPSGLFCHCRDLAATTAQAVTARPELVVDAAANRMAVKVGEAVVYAFTP
ncbi:MAG: hypothetical protein IT317_04325 [Anaerolineales bacterium]|nr:hypothetical protein [Anaerolineales bacterium]